MGGTITTHNPDHYGYGSASKYLPTIVQCDSDLRFTRDGIIYTSGMAPVRHSRLSPHNLVVRAPSGLMGYDDIVIKLGVSHYWVVQEKSITADWYTGQIAVLAPNTYNTFWDRSFYIDRGHHIEKIALMPDMPSCPYALIGNSIYMIQKSIWHTDTRADWQFSTLMHITGSNISGMRVRNVSETTIAVSYPEYNDRRMGLHMKLYDTRWPSELMATFSPIDMPAQSIHSMSIGIH